MLSPECLVFQSPCPIYFVYTSPCYPPYIYRTEAYAIPSSSMYWWGSSVATYSMKIFQLLTSAYVYIVPFISTVACDANSYLCVNNVFFRLGEWDFLPFCYEYVIVQLFCVCFSSGLFWRKILGCLVVNPLVFLLLSILLIYCLSSLVSNFFSWLLLWGGFSTFSLCFVK